MIKSSLLLATVLAGAAFGAQAGELYSPQSYQQPASSVTRAQVRQSVLQAQKAGELQHNDVDLPGHGASSPDDRAFGKTRAAARADVLAARERGELNHTDVDVPNVATGSSLTRQQVRADAIAANRAPRTAPGRNTIAY